MFNKKFISLLLCSLIAISSNTYTNFISSRVFAAAPIEEEEEDNSETYETIAKFMYGIRALGAEITQVEINEFGEDIEYWALKYITVFRTALSSTEDVATSETATTLLQSLNEVLNNNSAREALISCTISEVISGDALPDMYSLLHFCEDIYTFSPEIVNLTNELISGMTNQTDYAVCKAFVDTNAPLTPCILEYFSRLVKSQDIDICNPTIINQFVLAQEPLIIYFLSLRDIGSNYSNDERELSLALFDCYLHVEGHFGQQANLFELLSDGTRVVKRHVLEAMMYIAGTPLENGEYPSIIDVSLDELNAILSQ